MRAHKVTVDTPMAIAPCASPVSVATRIRVLEQELRDLRQRQLEDLVVAIVKVTGDHAFNAVELLRHAQRVSRALGQVLDEAGITTPRRVGKFLQHWQRRPIAGWRLERVCRDEAGIVWAVYPRGLTGPR